MADSSYETLAMVIIAIPIHVAAYTNVVCPFRGSVFSSTPLGRGEGLILGDAVTLCVAMYDLVFAILLAREYFIHS